jgi:acyl-CoA synthetase
VEAAAAALRDGAHAVVGAHDGGVSFLRLADGALTWRYAAAGAVKAPLTVDAWRGAAWGASHGRDAFALCVNARAALWTHRLDGAVSAAPAADARRRRVYFATLAGSVYAIDDARSEAEGGGACADSHRHVDAPREAWRVSLGAAVFGAPAVVARTGDVLIASVDGAVTCLAARDGARAWRVHTAGASAGASAAAPLFAPLALCEGALPGAALIGTHAGALLCLRCADGATRWALQLPGRGRVTAAAAVDAAPPAWWHPHTARAALLAVATTAGDVFIIEAPQQGANDAAAGAVAASPRIVAAARLPGEAFSAPVMHAGALLLGCRDDWLYGLQLRPQAGQMNEATEDTAATE